MLKKLALCLLCLYFPSGIYAQEAPSLTADEIVEVVIQKHLENDRLKGEKVMFRRRETTHSLDKNGNKKFPAKEDELLNSRNAKNPIDLNRFLTRYVFSFAIPAEDSENYRINFRPKSKTPDESEIIYQTANRLQGTLYINKQFLYVSKFEAKLIDSFNKFIGTVRVRHVAITFEQERRSDLEDIIVLSYFTIIVKYRAALVFEVFEQWDYIYLDYQLKP